MIKVDYYVDTYIDEHVMSVYYSELNQYSLIYHIDNTKMIKARFSIKLSRYS